ncbi:caspase family protein [Pseudorhodoplanes sp.]|uniref:caspase family protein n=1 Tax=Pseudorhodoplanes sp. TaxID=1934341 RepID=UPI00391DD955
MKRLTAILFGLWAAAALAAGPAFAEKRVALVIGNGAYENATRLANPINDATAMADLFRKAGFDVVEARTDLGNLEFKRVAREFTLIARDADIAVMYFAGHGIEVNGTNYLLPVDAKLATDFDVEDEALSLDRLIRALEPAKRLRLIILDACRDNPFVTTMRRNIASRQVTSGLAKVEPATSDTLIAFAARAGSTAEDGRGKNSPFTTALVKNLTVPGRDVRIALGYVRDEVLRTTGNRQEPFVYGSLGGATVALVPERKQIAAPPPAPPPSVRSADPRLDYEFAERVGTREAWDSFLSVHTSGFYADLARAQREKVSRAAQPVIPQVPPPPRVSAAQPQQDGTAATAESPAAPTESAPPAAVAALPESASREIAVLPAPKGDQRVIARGLQTELRRVGCDPGAIDGVWSPKAQAALALFNRHAGASLDTEQATIAALDAVKAQRGRICPLICGAGQQEQGGRCVAIPQQPKPKKEAVRPPELGAREKARERARERARAQPKPEPRRPSASRAVCPAGSSPFSQGGRMCCEVTPDGRGAPRIFCP